MSAIQQQAYSAPFDAVAARYDETFTRSLIGRAQRSAVWRELEKTFHPGDRILEVGCGTGVDACFLGQRGVRVTACDSSSQMIGVAAQKVRDSGLDELVQPRLLRAEDIARLPANEPFDGALSNFGALNCVDDLGKIARDLARLLKPGASALLCWMGPRCAWEMIWYLREGNRTKALRRLQPDGVMARIADGAVLHVHYPTVRLLAHAFAPYFRVKSVKGIGVALPPSYLEPWAQRHPMLFRLCERADFLLGRCPGIRMFADHLLVRLQRVDTARFMVEL